MNYRVGDVVRMKKPHPCGSSTWKILRVGADFRIKCTGCGRVVMLSRPQFMKNVRGIADSGLGGDADSKSRNRGPA
jgi:hypothetical protein